MRTAREVPAIVISEEHAQDLLARGRNRSVRVTPLRDLEGKWFLAPNVAAEMDARKTHAYLDDHVSAKQPLTSAVLLEDDSDDDGVDERVSVRALDGTTEVRMMSRDKGDAEPVVIDEG